jgi:hypothetical protein
MIRSVVVAAVALLAARPAAADAIKPEARAKAALDAQLATFKQGVAGEKAFLAMFDPAGVVIGDGGAPTAKDVAADAEDHTLARLFAIAYDGKVQPIKSLVAGKLTAGGVADAVWFTFDLTETHWTTQRYRISELLVNRPGDRGGTWKIAVAHIAVPRPDSWEDDEPSLGGGPTEWGAFPDGDDAAIGPIAHFAIAPTALAAALAKDPTTVVIGTGPSDLAIGPAAGARMLAGWSKLKLELDAAVETTTKTWGYAVVEVKLPSAKKGPHGSQSMKMRATIFATPKGDAWQIVAVQYSRVQWR